MPHQTTDQSQPHTDTVLAALLGSRARLAVLRLFLIDPSRTYYQRQVEAATGLPIRAVQRELERLTSVGLFYRRLDGNRNYYQVDVHSWLFAELRALILKACEPEEQLRARLAVDDSVRLAFLCETRDRTLVVAVPGREPPAGTYDSDHLEFVSSEDFVHMLFEAPQQLAPFLKRGLDLLGRRDDPIWHQIERAGFEVQKGKGVP